MGYSQLNSWSISENSYKISVVLISILLKEKCTIFVNFYVFCSYYFSVFKLDDFEKVQHAIFMFKDLFGLSRFDSDSLIRFTLTVRKNYRRVPYHNWTHGFSVANSMYSVIKHSQNAFKANEVSIITWNKSNILMMPETKQYLFLPLTKV
jgi:hypothetical protein